MKKIKLTDTEVEKLPFAEKGKQVDYYDSELDGFGLRVSATGKKYFVRTLLGSKRIRVMMKSTQLISAKDARKEAIATLGDMAKGIDPNAAKQQARQKAAEDETQSKTLQAALDEYVSKGKLKPRTITTYKDLCRLYLADWLNKPAAEITRDMVKARHKEIATGKRQRVKPAKGAEAAPREAAADNAMRVLRSILNYAFEDEEGGTVYANPVNVLSSKKRKAWFKVGRRSTLVKNSDLPAWFKAVMSLDNAIMRDYLLFLIFTGLRRQEAATLTWRQIDFEEGCFTIMDTKNKQPHTLPLSDYLRKLLTERKEGLKTELAEAKAALPKLATMTLRDQQTARNRFALAESRLASPYVFPGEGKTGYIVEPRRAIDAVTAATGITFTCHDLRRTFATLAESLDLSGYTVKALLNHKQQTGDVTGGYIILNVDRLRDPMQKITGALLERIKTKHGQVVQFRAEV